tara:strand:- start:652 stop:846 length:195 start_codon:yes stop_codon:yes gene_type:complete
MKSNQIFILFIAGGVLAYYLAKKGSKSMDIKLDLPLETISVEPTPMPKKEGCDSKANEFLDKNK